VATPHSSPSPEVWEDLVRQTLDTAGVAIQGRKTQVLAQLSTRVQRSASNFYCFASKYSIKDLPHGITEVSISFPAKVLAVQLSGVFPLHVGTLAIVMTPELSHPHWVIM
jgi:hypothetical protein